jgi:PiT family inorganic phosphate transporter
MRTVGLIFLVLVALGFDFTNGFHDAANAVAVSITTRALRPMTALLMAAGLNVVGALVSTKVAATVGDGIISTPTGCRGCG